MVKAIFSLDSVIQNDTDIDSFIPPYPGWNYVRILNHPEDPDDYSIDRCGKWLLFIPDSDFLDAFRKIAKLAKDMKLTHCFKALGKTDGGDEHVFCIYCSDCSNISFVKKIANILLSEGLLGKYGYKYKDGIKALFFKTDNATHYKSRSRGQSLTLFKFTDKGELYVKEFHDDKPHWRLVTNDPDPSIIENFELYLTTLEMKDLDTEEL